jgi:pimeloyl-ACP methyl ester carboxylesterase
MRKVVSRDGTTIAYERAGEGPPVVLLGGGFRDHTVFTSLIPELAPHCTVYAYDRRGRGESGDAPGYAVRREIEDLEAVIAEAGGRAAVFGGSSGAILALEAAMAGAPISRLALLEPPYRMEGFRRPPDDLPDKLDALLAQDLRGEACEYFLAECVGFPPEWIEEWRNSPMWSANEAMAHTLPYDTAILGDSRLPAGRLGALRTQTLVINSDSTGDWLLAAAKATAAVLPNGRRLELPGVWHRVLPDVLGPALAAYVTG